LEDIMSFLNPDQPPAPPADLSLRQWCLVLAADKVPHENAEQIVTAAKAFEAYLIEKTP
jgi:hypothetical protein